MYGILYDFIYWTSSNILSFSDGIKIKSKIQYQHKQFMAFSLTSYNE